MSLRIVLDLSDRDLTHFRKLARQAMQVSTKSEPAEIVAGARRLIGEIKASKASDFIREKLEQINVMIAMYEDQSWGLDDAGRKRVLAALAYFNQPEDLIPNHLPGIGYLDDAIMIELLARELRPELDAYGDFVEYRKSEAKRLGKKPSELARGDYLESRRQALHSRMRRRRRTGARSSRRRSPFSLF